jgi:hypothetical protein
MLDLSKVKENTTYSFKVWYLVTNNFTKEEVCILIIQAKIKLSETITIWIVTHFLVLKNETNETFSFHDLSF